MLKVKRGTPTFRSPQPLSNVNEREKNCTESDKFFTDALCDQLFHFIFVKFNARAIYHQDSIKKNDWK